eukprot:GHVQ01038676.1.p1 GENE.GHVQ01038676.1~~GHVQ01038676.1.p1  ORF type:complete len:225 (+),score=33.32 GHVQ01038676.1:1282-1956(+)
MLHDSLLVNLCQGCIKEGRLSDAIKYADEVVNDWISQKSTQQVREEDIDTADNETTMKQLKPSNGGDNFESMSSSTDDMSTRPSSTETFPVMSLLSKALYRKAMAHFKRCDYKEALEATDAYLSDVDGQNQAVIALKCQVLSAQQKFIKKEKKMLQSAFHGIEGDVRSNGVSSGRGLIDGLFHSPYLTRWRLTAYTVLHITKNLCLLANEKVTVWCCKKRRKDA